MIIIIDSREQHPYSFEWANPAIMIGPLKTGDYSLQGLEAKICVERKSLTDAYSSFGVQRDRFEREIIRMAEINFAVVMIEADWNTIINHPPPGSKLNPKTIHASIIAWEQRYNIHFWTCPNRNFAERTTYRILERFYEDINKNK